MGARPKSVTTPATKRLVEDPIKVVMPPKIDAKLSGISSRLTGIPIRSAKALIIGINIMTTGVLLRTLETMATGIRLMIKPRRALPPLSWCSVVATPSSAPVRTIASPTTSNAMTVISPGLANPPKILAAFN